MVSVSSGCFQPVCLARTLARSLGAGQSLVVFQWFHFLGVCRYRHGADPGTVPQNSPGHKGPRAYR
ncbi:MAG: hypothetical protein EHM77_05650 [Planctomycetaceae bacterium]|nr:MAG: hypothetical protein EHM77_05650 [Planctomycetaceae bacterium]